MAQLLLTLQAQEDANNFLCDDPRQQQALALVIMESFDEIYKDSRQLTLQSEQEQGDVRGFFFVVSCSWKFQSLSMLPSAKTATPASVVAALVIDDDGLGRAVFLSRVVVDRFVRLGHVASL